MKDTSERRILIVERVCELRHVSMGQLATEFQVSHRTIENDIQMLSRLFPLYTTTGIHGGVHVVEGYRLGMKYLSDPQCNLLETLSKSLDGEELALIQEIIKVFKKPTLPSMA